MRQMSTHRRDSLWDFMSEVERIFDDAWKGGETTRAMEAIMPEFSPQVSVRETDDNYLVSADLPGVPQENIKIEFAHGRLTISGERGKEEKSEGEHFHRYEKQFGRFERSFQLPTDVDESKIQARYENGVLEVLIPKTEVAKPRAINIESGKQGLFSKVLGATKGTSKTEKH